MLFEQKFKKIYKNKIKRIKKRYNKKFKEKINRLNSVLTHDIKTPVLAQIQSLELILNQNFGELNDKQKMILKEVLNSNYFLYNIVSNAIFLAEFDNKNPKLNLEKVDILKELENCLNMIKIIAKDKMQDIIIKADKNIKLFADKKLTEKILFNLLTSSVSSGFENSKIEVTLKENKNSVSFVAKNKSAYMTKEKINSMLEEKNNTRDFNQMGMSLNLNIVKKLIEAHNWDIIAQSDKNNSSSFGFKVKK